MSYRGSSPSDGSLGKYGVATTPVSCSVFKCHVLIRFPGQCCDEGKPFVAEHGDTIAGREYLKIVESMFKISTGLGLHKFDLLFDC